MHGPGHPLSLFQADDLKILTRYTQLEIPFPVSYWNPIREAASQYEKHTRRVSHLVETADTAWISDRGKPAGGGSKGYEYSRQTSASMNLTVRRQL
jgi:hypothetical protein